MAYLGRPGATAPLTSADIPAGSVSAVKVAADVATQAELDAKEEFASGTKMVFNQTAAPTGWTKVTGSGDDHALRLTTGTVGTGGDVNFETAFADLTVTPTISTPTITMSNDAETLSTAQLAAHTHNIQVHTTAGSHEVHKGGTNAGAYNITTASTGSGNTHTHTNTASSSTPTSNAVPIDINVKFVDVIIATKD